MVLTAPMPATLTQPSAIVDKAPVRGSHAVGPSLSEWSSHTGADANEKAPKEIQYRLGGGDPDGGPTVAIDGEANPIKGQSIIEVASAHAQSVRNRRTVVLTPRLHPLAEALVRRTLLEPVIEALAEMQSVAETDAVYFKLRPLLDSLLGFLDGSPSDPATAAVSILFEAVSSGSRASAITSAQYAVAFETVGSLIPGNSLPRHAVERAIAKLTDAGFTVPKCDTELPAAWKEAIG